MRRLIVCLSLILFALLSQACNPANATPESLRILFIGNSLTYTNNLPGMLQQMLVNAGIDATAEDVTFPNFGLQDHWSNRQALNAIRQGEWDIVIMQQGPSATEGRPSLLEYTQRYAEEIRAVGAVPGIYMVWPADARSFDFDGVSESHQMAADGVEGYLFPAGEAWRAAWREDSSIALYGPDRFHPSRLGTYVAALTMFEQLAQKDPTELPPEVPYPNGTVSIDPDVAKILQRAAVTANAEFAREPRLSD